MRHLSSGLDFYPVYVDFKKNSCKFDLKELNIPLPPIEEQTTIVSLIEEEQKMVDVGKKLIGLIEQKIKDKIGAVWGGDTVNS